ncbi:hypothetical protein [Nocardia asiatica]|uniref:hypothetical protein n=1 Tax=Nocardia asiatica TaxID=209252 RepID=UPI003EDF6C4A
MAARWSRWTCRPGTRRKGQLPRRPAEALAAQLDIPLTESPGGRSGSPAEFARLLLELLQAARVG